METELLPKFVQSPGYLALAAQLKPPARNGKQSLSGVSGPPAEIEAVNISTKHGPGEQSASQASNNFNVSSTPRELTIEDVLAGLHHRP
jgi:hypothetical protein